MRKTTNETARARQQKTSGHAGTEEEIQALLVRRVAACAAVWESPRAVQAGCCDEGGTAAAYARSAVGGVGAAQARLNDAVRAAVQRGCDVPACLVVGALGLAETLPAWDELMRAVCAHRLRPALLFLGRWSDLGRNAALVERRLATARGLGLTVVAAGRSM